MKQVSNCLRIALEYNNLKRSYNLPGKLYSGLPIKAAMWPGKSDLITYEIWDKVVAGTWRQVDGAIFQAPMIVKNCVLHGETNE